MEDFIDTPADLTPNEEQELNSTKELNEKQENFCHEYLKDFNGGLAAMRAGYKPYGACHTAYRLLRTLAVKKRLHELKQEQREQTHISFSFVVQRLIRIAEEAMEGDPVLVYDQSAKTWKDTGRKKPDRPTALKALTLLGKHIGMFDKEYTENKEKQESHSQEGDEKQSQLLDTYLDTSLELRGQKAENKHLKEILAEAGIAITPMKPEIGVYGNPTDPKVYTSSGPKTPINPSEYDDKPHYQYKRIRPHKNHPEHQVHTQEQLDEAIRKKIARLPTKDTPGGDTP